jgi:hypothetical protein
MLTLDLTNAPYWCELVPGVRVKLRPLTTALMVAARSDPAIADLPKEARTEEAALAMAKALARSAILDWDGIGDAEGNAIAVSPDAIDALLDTGHLASASGSVLVVSPTNIGISPNFSSCSMTKQLERRLWHSSIRMREKLSK